MSPKNVKEISRSVFNSNFFLNLFIIIFKYATRFRYPHVKDRSAFIQFFKELVSNSYLGWEEKLQTKFTEIHPDEFWKIAFDIRWKFTYNVSNSNQENYGVVNMRSFMTDIGICYSYNSLASPYSEKE